MLLLRVKSSLIKEIVFMCVAVTISVNCLGQQHAAPAKTDTAALQLKTESRRSTYKFISTDEAEKVLGGKTHVRDSSWKISGGILRYMTTILSYANDKKTGQNKKLFFSYEEYQHEGEAKDIYSPIKEENGKSAVVNDFAETGDEAFWVIDQSGFPFIMVRKNKKIFKFKIYYVTKKGAFEQLQALAKRIVTDN